MTVQSLWRQVFMILDLPTQALEVAFTIQTGDVPYMVYVSSGLIKRFYCGDVGQVVCKHIQLAVVHLVQPLADATSHAVAEVAIAIDDAIVADVTAGPAVDV